MTTMEERDSVYNLVSLQNNLLKVWEQQKVDQYYQNIILTYLDNLPPKVAERKIIEEIKACHEGHSQFSQFTQKLNKRKRILQTLEQILKKKDIQNTIRDQLAQICQLINQLRDHNLMISQILINLHINYTGNYRQISDQFLQILINLDRDNQMLKNSVLSNYIMFQNGYDPFFLHHYDTKKYKRPLKSSQEVNETFNINISYACRLYKTKTKILEMLGTGKMDFSDSNKQITKKIYKTLHNDQQDQLNHHSYHMNYNQGKERNGSSFINFKQHSLSLQQSKENHKKTAAKYDNQSFYKNNSQRKPIYNPKLFKQIAQDNKAQPNGYQGQESMQQIVVIKRSPKLNRKPRNYIKKENQFYQLVPVRYSRIEHGQSEVESYRPPKSNNLIQSSRYTKNFKEKLKPLYQANQDQTQQANQNISSLPRKYYMPPPSLTIKYPVILQRNNQNYHKNQRNIMRVPNVVYQQPQVSQTSSKMLPVKKYSDQNQNSYEQSPNSSNMKHYPRRQHYVPEEYPTDLNSQYSPAGEKSYYPPKGISNIKKSIVTEYNSKQRQQSDIQLKQYAQTDPKQYAQKPNKKQSIPQNPIDRQSQQKPKKKASQVSLKQDIKLSSNNKRQMKIRAGKLSFSQLITYIKGLNLPSQLKNKLVNDPEWIKSISTSQSYIIEFILNDEISNLSIVHALPQGDYLIKFWGQMLNCDEDINSTMFKRYIQHLERFTTANQIYYMGDQIKQLTTQQFELKKDKTYVRKRVAAKPEKQLQFPQFLSIKCTNIIIPQDKIQSNLLYSEQIQPFKSDNYHVSPHLLDVDKDNINKNLVMMMKISEDIENMNVLNKLLEDQDFDTFQVTSNMKISAIAAIRIFAQTRIKSPFIAYNGYLKYSCQESSFTDKNIICKLNGHSVNIKLVFGKGFDNMTAFVQNCKKTMNQACIFSVKMFSKQLYGRLTKENDKCLYGNWQISLSWQDELQGKLKHQMTQNHCFGPEPFYVGIQFQAEIIIAFIVKNQDCLF